MTPLQRTHAIAREATDAQQDVIKEMREQIEELRVERVELREAMRHMVRFDDPVVTGLVDSVLDGMDARSTFAFRNAQAALSAYEARVKSIEPAIQNHGHINIDYKYNNETTTMSPARVKEVSRE